MAPCSHCGTLDDARGQPYDTDWFNGDSTMNERQRESLQMQVTQAMTRTESARVRRICEALRDASAAGDFLGAARTVAAEQDRKLPAAADLAACSVCLDCGCVGLHERIVEHDCPAAVGTLSDSRD